MDPRTSPTALSATLVATVIGTLAAGAPAQVPALSNPALNNQVQIVNDVFNLKASRVVRIEADMIAGQPVTTTLELDGTPYTLNLVPQTVRAADFRLLHQVESGELIEVDPGPVRTLRGGLAEVPGSTAAAVLLDDGLHVSVELPGAGRYWAQPLGKWVPGSTPEDYVVYRDTDVIPSGGTCGLDHAPVDAVLERDVQLPEGTVAGGACDIYVAELACDADFPYFQDWGGITETRIEGVINSMNQQYENEVGITHVITAIVVRTSSAADPYNSSEAGTLLNEFRTYWLQNHNDIQRDVAHLFTGRNLNGGTIGIAWGIGEICTSGAYCLSQSDCCCCPSFACATDLSAHELGHLWGASHCNCPGWTMNPTINCANQFTAGSEASIIAHRDSRTCLDEPDVPANDDCAVGQSIFPDTPLMYTNICATTDGYNEPDICTFNNYSTIQSDVWFRWTANQCDGDGIATLSLCGSGYNTKMAVYEGVLCPEENNLAIACNDDACGIASELSFPFLDGEFYRIRVGGYAGDQGNGTILLTLDCTAADCPADVDGDGEVAVTDLTAVILAWGTDDAAADVNGDGIVDVSDLTELVLAWGPCP